MSAFYVTQRVRVVRVPLQPSRAYVGMEGVVDALDVVRNGKEPGCVGIAAHGLLWAFPPENLEPITPPGMESLAETLALWLPEDERAAA